jgi:glycerol-3-phosphate dehydrogenase
MAEHAVDAVLQAVPSLQSVASPCVTETLQLVGARGWDRATFTEVAQNYVVPHRPGAIDTRVAEHLSQSYGTRAMEVTRLAEAEKLGHRLARGQPWIEAEVAYCCRHEMCETAEDFIARRTRMAFLDVLATREALPKIIELMQKEKGWSGRRARQEREHAETFLATFDSPAKKNMGNINAIPAHE